MIGFWDSFGPTLALLALLFVVICLLLIEAIACEVPAVLLYFDWIEQVVLG